MPDVEQHELAEAAMLSSLADETPEGRSIVELAESHYGQVAEDVPGAELVPFTAQTRMSGLDVDGRSIRKGAADSVRRWVEEQGGTVPVDLAPGRGDHLQGRRHAAGGGRRARGSSG